MLSSAVSSEFPAGADSYRADQYRPQSRRGAQVERKASHATLEVEPLLSPPLSRRRPGFRRTTEEKLAGATYDPSAITGLNSPALPAARAIMAGTTEKITKMK